MNKDDWHSLGSSDGDWFYMKVNDFSVEDGFSHCDFEIYKNDDDKPIMAIKENLAPNIMQDIEEIINKLRREYDTRFDEPDYEGYKLREQERKRDAQEAWLFRNSIR
jgi:hypothetical protein